MTHDPLCGWHTKTGCFDEQDDCWECVIIARTRADERSNNFTPDQVSDIATQIILEERAKRTICPACQRTPTSEGM